MPDELVHVGPHAAILASGRSVGPGDRVKADELSDEDQHLLDNGHLVEVGSFSGASNTPEKPPEKAAAKPPEKAPEAKSEAKPNPTPKEG